MEDLKIGYRLTKLRKEHGLTQGELAKKLSLLCGKPNTISISAVSSWELGVKNPRIDILAEIAKFYNVSMDYLIGNTDKRENIDPEISSVSSIKPLLFLDYFTIEIEESMLNQYDGKPLFLVFDNENIENRWGIYNKERNIFLCKENMVKNSRRIRKYVIDKEMLPKL